MGQVYDRPPNYETPAEHLIGRQNYPYTDNEYYYVRYREASVLQLTPENYRLKIGGDAADNEITLTLDELQRRASTTIGAVGVCSGEGRGLHHPMIPGMPWTKGDLSCAEWTGVPLNDLLHEVGVKDSALHVSFGGGRVISLAKPQYWRSYMLETIRQYEPLVATQMNGEDIPFWNGYPVRLVFPGTWAPTWTKQLVEIDIRSTPNEMEWSGREITPNELLPVLADRDPHRRHPGPGRPQGGADRGRLRQGGRHHQGGDQPGRGEDLGAGGAGEVLRQVHLAGVARDRRLRPDR